LLVAAVAVPKPWGALQEQDLKQLYEPYFMKKIAEIPMQQKHQRPVWSPQAEVLHGEGGL
jgi:hypothetical protein